MNSEYLLYLQEIKNTEWVIELISEQFDDAMNMMTPNSVIYGGAVRDCLAGKDLEGDLDIAVSASECTSMINKFVRNPKWINISNKDNELRYKGFDPVDILFTETPRKRLGPKVPQIMTFETLGNKTVQIIILPPTCNDPFQTVTNMVKQVDIVCCGVILTNDNKVFEVVPNAYKDCKEHILRLNNVCYTKDIENFKQRIEKLSERGWINKIDIKKVIRTINRMRVVKRNQDIKRLPKKSNTNPESYTHTIKKPSFPTPPTPNTTMREGYVILKDAYVPQKGDVGGQKKFNYAEEAERALTHTGYRLVLSVSDIEYLGGLSNTLHALDDVAEKYKLDIVVQPTHDYFVIITRNKHISDKVYEIIMRNIVKSNKRPSTGVNPKKASFAFNKAEMSQIYVNSLQVKKEHIKISKQSGNTGPMGADLRRNFNFNYSNAMPESEHAMSANKYHEIIHKDTITRIGGISIALIRLERIAKKHKLDIEITRNQDDSVTIVTKNKYISNHIINLMRTGPDTGLANKKREFKRQY